MAKVDSFDAEVLHEHYQQAAPLDLGWLGKASRHQFRWRCTKNRWHTSSRQIRSGEVLAKQTLLSTPRDMYVSTSAWLNPVNLPKIKDTQTPHPVLIDHLIVFDIDIPPFSKSNMERARRSTVSLLDWVEQEHDFQRIHIVFSGSKGFHLVYREKDRSRFSIPDPREREMAVRSARKALLQSALDAGHPVDAGITADTRRIIRLPGSIHGSTGWECTILTEDQLRSPLKKWVKELPRHQNAIRMPRRAKSSKKKVKQVNTKPDTMAFTSLELSTHVRGTKDRNALVAWLPPSWGSRKDTVDKATEIVEQKQTGPAWFWTDHQRVLMMLPRAFPRQKAAKLARAFGLENTALSIESNDHDWVRIGPRQWESEDWDGAIEPLAILGRPPEHHASSPWSLAHLEMASRLNLPYDAGQDVCSGSIDPSIRVVNRK